jgi:phosphatidylglycerophosphate synthase
VPYDRRPSKIRSLAPTVTLAKILSSRGIGPNLVSLTGLGSAIAGFICLWGAARGWPGAWFFVLLATVLVLVRLLCNLLDGLLAIEFDRREKAGDIYNEIPDRFEDTLFLVGAGYLAGSVELGWIAAVLAVFTAYVRTFGASLGQSQDFGGPCAKPHRMVILMAGLIGDVMAYFAKATVNVPKITLWIIIIGTSITALLRLRRLYRALP